MNCIQSVSKTLGPQTLKFISNQTVNAIYLSGNINAWTQVLYMRSEILNHPGMVVYNLNQQRINQKFVTNQKIFDLLHVKPIEYLTDKIANKIDEILNNPQKITYDEDIVEDNDVRQKRNYFDEILRQLDNESRIYSITVPAILSMAGASIDVPFLEKIAKSAVDGSETYLNMFHSYINCYAKYNSASAYSRVIFLAPKINITDSKIIIETVGNKCYQQFTLDQELMKMVDEIRKDTMCELDLNICEDAAHFFNDVLDEIASLQKQ